MTSEMWEPSWSVGQRMEDTLEIYRCVPRPSSCVYQGWSHEMWRRKTRSLLICNCQRWCSVWVAWWYQVWGSHVLLGAHADGVRSRRRSCHLHVDLDRPVLWTEVMSGIQEDFFTFAKLRVLQTSKQSLFKLRELSQLCVKNFARRSLTLTQERNL